MSQAGCNFQNTFLSFYEKSLKISFEALNYVNIYPWKKKEKNFQKRETKQLFCAMISFSGYTIYTDKLKLDSDKINATCELQ